MRLGIYFYITAIIVFSACGAENRKADTKDIENNPSTPENPIVPNGKLGTPKFETTEHNFGKIIDGESVQHKFKFKNTGEGELVVANVQASCGCTTPDWTRDIIAPGGEGFVLATFNSAGRGEKNGLESKKHITVTFSNSTVSSLELTFTANIFTKD